MRIEVVERSIASVAFIAISKRNFSGSRPIRRREIIWHLYWIIFPIYRWFDEVCLAALGGGVASDGAGASR